MVSHGSYQMNPGSDGVFTFAVLTGALLHDPSMLGLLGDLLSVVFENYNPSTLFCYHLAQPGSIPILNANVIDLTRYPGMFVQNLHQPSTFRVGLNSSTAMLRFDNRPQHFLATVDAVSQGLTGSISLNAHPGFAYRNVAPHHFEVDIPGLVVVWGELSDHGLGCQVLNITD